METFLIPVLLQSFITIFLLNATQHKDRDSFYLNALLIVFSFHLGYKAFLWYSTGTYDTYNKVHGAFTFLYGPLLYLFFKNRPGAIGRFGGAAKDLLHFVPFFIGFIFNGCILKQILFFNDFSNLENYQRFSQVAVSLSTSSYALVTLSQAAFSRELPRLKKYIVIAVALVLCIPIFFLVLAKFTVLPQGLSRIIWYGGIFTLINLILYLKLKTEREKALVPVAPPATATVAQEPTRSYQNSALTESAKKHLQQQLETAMRKDKLFLDSSLTLEILAKKLDAPKHHLTEVLNVVLNTSFYNYINTYRIKEAIRLLENSEDDTLLIEICFDCGFKSKSTFNKYFKEITGTSPKEYRRNHMLSQVYEHQDLLIIS